MADISLKIKAQQLKKDLEKVSQETIEEINQAVKNVAYSAYSAMQARLQTMGASQSNRKSYMQGLNIIDLGDNSYLITLDGDWANKLEQGFSGYSIRDQLLKSNKKVGVGSRAGEPWVRTAKDGHKWAVVPFEHRPHAAGKAGDLAADIKKLVGEGLGGKQQPITKTWKGLDDAPLSGKVATVKSIPEGMNQNLKGLVKFQHIADSGKVSSLYMTFRGVSETGKDWRHPGFDGYQLFKQAEDFVEKEMDNILNTLLE